MSLPLCSSDRVASVLPTEPSAVSEGDRPWRCPHCRYDVRGLAFGDHCSECGTTLDERAGRPRWTRPAQSARMRAWTLVGVGANLTPPAAALTIVLLNILGLPDGGTLYPTLALVALSVHIAAHVAACAGIASLDNDAARARRLRWSGVVRAGSIVIATALPLAVARFGAPNDLAIILLIVTFAAPAAIIVADMQLALVAPGLARDAELPPSAMRRRATRGAIAVLAFSYLLSLVPALDWILIPLVGCVVNAIGFRVMARTISHAARGSA